ncbi:MAG TPA: ABC transporter C-terminal domain-containing protein [Steroidobacteraceae bacterium]|nr:ABC transporter C-terminal domain-containing protein [Steroidobacteraceae bacterium]
MAVPWLVVGKLVLSNLDTIIGVVKPAFTRKKVDALPSQTDLLNQQIAELQAAASNNAEQITQLAAQLKEVVAALEQAGTEAAAHRAATRKLSYVAVSASVLAMVLSMALAFTR